MLAADENYPVMADICAGERSKNKKGNPQGGDTEDGRGSKKSLKKKEKQKPKENASKTRWIKNARRKYVKTAFRPA